MKKQRDGFFFRMKISRRGYLPDIFTYGSALAASRMGGWQRPFDSKLWVASFGCFQNSGTPKMDGENNGNPYEQMGWFGGSFPTIFGNPLFKWFFSGGFFVGPFFLGGVGSLDSEWTI